MVQIGNVPEIVRVKQKLAELEERGLIKAWELPYENLLTRLDAGIFFLALTDGSVAQAVWNALGELGRCEYSENTNQSEGLSRLPWQVRFAARDAGVRS